MEKAKVAVFIGSASDEATVAPCADILKKLGIPFRFTVTSAHRTPERTAELVDSLEAAGCEVFICAAGMAAHLAKAGARNAAWLAAQILALHDPELAHKIRISRERFKSDVAVAGAEIEAKYC